MIQQFAFIITLAIATFFIGRRVSGIRKNIQLGKSIDRKGNAGERFKNMLLVAFGQKKMYKRITPAVLHFFIYVGFVVINLEVLEFVQKEGFYKSAFELT